MIGVVSYLAWEHRVKSGPDNSSPPGLSRDPLLSPERVRSPTLLEYTKDKPMKEVEPDWNKWVPSVNYLERWLANTDLGKSPSDEEKA